MWLQEAPDPAVRLFRVERRQSAICEAVLEPLPEVFGGLKQFRSPDDKGEEHSYATDQCSPFPPPRFSLEKANEEKENSK